MSNLRNFDQMVMEMGVCGLYTDCKLDKLAASGGVQQVAMGGVQLQPQALQGDMNMLGTSGDVGKASA